jgi:iron complex transport system substrate-binding protein
MTQILVDLGHEDRIVGLHSYDPHAGDLAPAVGDLFQIDYEKLLTLRPTDIFIQPTIAGVPSRLTELAMAHGWGVHPYKIELRDDVLGAIDDAGRRLDDEPAAAKLRASIESHWRAIESLTAGRPRVPTLLVIGRNPMNCAGPDTFLSQMLQAAGGVNVLPASSNRYPVLDREAVVRLDPRIILSIHSTEPDESRRLELTESLRPRIRTLSDPAAVLPSSTLPRILAKMARLIHPDLAGAIDAATAEWERR